MLVEQENIEDVREIANLKEMKNKRKMERYFNAKMKDKGLAKGDLVLRNARMTGADQDKGKLSPESQLEKVLLL